MKKWRDKSLSVQAGAQAPGSGQKLSLKVGGHCHNIHFLKLKMLSINVRAGRD